ncbi:MAG: cytidylate kinase-like family protein, partial [Desulfurobacterium sp.]
MNRAEEAIDVIYEDEELIICCEDVLPAIERFLIQLDETLPFYVNADFFIELVDKIRNELLSGNRTLKEKLLEGKMGIVTVTFELGSLGLDVAKAIGEKLGYRVVFG